MKQAVIEALRGHGIQPSPQRVAVAEYVLDTHDHPSADQVWARARRRLPVLSRATVYNTLKLFVEKKLIRELIVDPAKIVYDPNTEPHHHLYDVATGRLTDIPADNIRVLGLPPLPAGTVADGVDIIVRTRPES